MVHVVFEHMNKEEKGKRVVIELSHRKERFAEDWKNLVSFKLMRRTMKPVGVFETEQEAIDFMGGEK